MRPQILLFLLLFASFSYSHFAVPQQLPGEIEIVQAVQSLQQDVPLIAKKRTLVRVYLDEHPAGKVGGRIEIKAISSGRTTQVRSMNLEDFSLVGTSDLVERHRDLTKSLNFVVPAEFTEEGQVSIRTLGLADESGNTVPCGSCPSTSRSITFEPAPVVNIMLIGIAYNTDRQSPLAYPSDDDFTAVRDWISRAYPTAFVQISRRDAITAGNINLHGHFACTDVNDQLHTLQLKDRNYSNIHYYGLVSDKYFFMRGCSGIATRYDVWLAASGPAGDPSHPKDKVVAWDHDHTYAGWYAGHEIAHTLGRLHVQAEGCFTVEPTTIDQSFPYGSAHLSNSPEKYVGISIDPSFSLSNASVLPGLLWTDVMSYCPFEWISAYTYKGILQWERAQERAATIAQQSSIQAQELEASPRGYIDVIGSLNFTKSTARFIDVEHNATPSFPLGGESGNALLRTLDANGHVLRTFHADVYYDSDLPSGIDETGTTETSVPFDERIASLQLSVREGPPAVYSAGGQRAKVSDLRLVAVDSLNADEISTMQFSVPEDEARSDILIRWAPAEKGVTFTVQASKDGGRTWETFATRLERSFATLNPKRMGLANGDELIVRVTAQDGFQSYAAVTKRFTIRYPRAR